MPGPLTVKCPNPRCGATNAGLNVGCISCGTALMRPAERIHQAMRLVEVIPISEAVPKETADALAQLAGVVKGLAEKVSRVGVSTVSKRFVGTGRPAARTADRAFGRTAPL